MACQHEILLVNVNEELKHSDTNLHFVIFNNLAVKQELKPSMDNFTTPLPAGLSLSDSYTRHMFQTLPALSD